MIGCTTGRKGVFATYPTEACQSGAPRAPCAALNPTCGSEAGCVRGTAPEVMSLCACMADAVDDCLFDGAKAVVVLVFPDSYSATFAREAVRARSISHSVLHAHARLLHNRACMPCVVLLPLAGTTKLTSVPVLVSVHMCLFVVLYLGASVQQRSVTAFQVIALLDCNAGTKHTHLLSCC